MKRQDPPAKCESVGAPSSAAAVVCVVPPARRSPCAEPAGSGPTPLRHTLSGPLRHPLPAAAPTPAVQPRLTAAAAAPPHLLTALAQAAAGPQPAAVPLGYARAAPSHAAVYGENLTVRRDSSSPFQPATAPPQGVGVTTLSSGSVQTLSSATAPQLPHMAHQTSVRRQQQPTGVLTQSMVGSSASAAVGSGSKPPSMPAAAAASATAPPESAHPPSYHRLKVEDALSYLDQVKSKFQNNPEVYNDFLDIMKEFKAQNIDTPGVITRVSSLFRGHPALIVGFNTFLPPGYKIEVQSSNDYLHVSMTAPGQVTTVVHTPTGGLQTYHDQTDVAHHHPTAMMISKQVPHPPPSQQQQQTQPSTVAAQPQSFRGPYGTNNIVSGPLGGGQHGAGGHHTYTQQLQQGSGVATSSALPVQLPAQQQPAAASTQPVEFNHAINYVNKIKNRFQGQPEVYKQFLEILHTYQKEQRCLKEGVAASGPVLSETEVYAKVAALFQSHEDLMDEFGQFLPDATNGNAVSAVNNSRSVTQDHVSARPASVSAAAAVVASVVVDKPVKSTFQPVSKPLKRSIPTPPAASPVAANSPSAAAAVLPAKKPRVGVIRDVTLAEAAKYGTLNDFAFFDQVRKTLRNQDVYNNFLRVLSLYNTEIISRSDVIQLVTPFIGRKPGLLKWLKDFMGVKDGRDLVEPIALGMSKPERAPGDQTVEIDPSTCKRLGASYCALPKSYPQPRCTGRNQLCREVLNDTWVSFPSYSEDSTFVTSRKTQYEEYIYRCEDERFELDMVLEINLATIRILEGVQKKLSRMAPEDAARHRLDDCLGGTSPTVHQRAVRRIYGEKGGDIIDGLKKNPIVAVPVVLRRLKAKQDEWREAQKGYNKIWREQNEKYYLKSLDPQGINFKQTDVKMLRSKALLNELYTLFDERHEQLDEGDGTAAVPTCGPHMQLVYANRRVLPDAASLIIHHVKRQTSIQNEDKTQMKHLLRHTLVGMLHAQRQRRRSDSSDDDEEELAAASDEDVDPSPPSYTLFMASSNWYLFLRLHQLLCERLDRIYQRAVELARAEQTYKKLRSESAAIALRLKPKNEVDVEDYYPAFLDLVKSVLDNSMDSSQYEDTLREMFGTHAYHAFTADKIVSGAVRQLQHIVTENVAQLTLKEYQSELEGGGAGGPCSTADQRQQAETAYIKRVEQLLTDENEHCMKIYLFSGDGRMTIELLDTTDSEDSEDGFAEEKRRSSYQEKYASPGHQTDDELRSAAASTVCLPLFLARNLRRRGARRHQQLQLLQDSDVVKQEAGDTAADSRGRRDEGSMAVDGAAAGIKQEPLQMSGEEQFKLGADYRFQPVVKTGSYLHRRNCLTGARARHGAVSTRLNVRFRSWHAGWLDRHVCARQLQLCADWLMGRQENTKPCRTFVLTDNDLDRPPYSQYNRYRVEWLSDHS